MKSNKTARIFNAAAICLAVVVIAVIAGCNPTGHFADVTTILGNALGGLGI